MRIAPRLGVAGLLVRLLAGLFLVGLFLVGLGTRATAGPPQPSVRPLADGEQRKRCGSLPPPDAPWFFLGAPPEGAQQRPSLLAIDALTQAFGDQLPRNIACIRIQILHRDGLADRYGKLDRRRGGGPPAGVVGFHTPALGADSTVYVTPQSHIPLEAVITHEVLHALSHRYSMEAQRRRLSHMVEGATDWVTRELAAATLAIPKTEYHTGYDAYVAFFDALVKRLGTDGNAMLIDAYFRTGYYAFESEVDEKLGISLREAARSLEADDLRAAMEGLGVRPAGRRRP